MSMKIKQMHTPGGAEVKVLEKLNEYLEILESKTIAQILIQESINSYCIKVEPPKVTPLQDKVEPPKPVEPPTPPTPVAPAPVALPSGTSKVKRRQTKTSQASKT